MTIGGEQRLGGGEPIDTIQPHRRAHVLGTMRNATHQDAQAAVDAAPRGRARVGRHVVRRRAAVLLKAADLLAGPWRDTLNAATMLGQSKTVQQAEIDAACELIDFLRFNVAYGRFVIEQQPQSSPGVWNTMDYRPLEGFVYAVTPFNFTAIAGNLPLAPALMGNVVVWKPAPTQQLAAHLTMRLLEEAGLPPGVFNMVTGDGIAVSDVTLASRQLAGIHFTGSTKVFQQLWRTVGDNIASYAGYPRVVGGDRRQGLRHRPPLGRHRRAQDGDGAWCLRVPGAEVLGRLAGLHPAVVWDRMGDDFVAETESLTMGDVTDLSHFMGAVIDQRAFDRLADVLERPKTDPAIEVLAGGSADDSEGSSSGRRSSAAPTRRTTCSRPSTSARCSASSSTTTRSTTTCCGRRPTSRRTPSPAR
jgi:1-pyrroline-5-carboxylate dehydrogenase